MKKLKYIIISLTLFAVSCGDPDLPFDAFDDLGKGGYARKLSQSGEFNFFDVTNSALTINVEFYDENNGNNVSSYRWNVQFLDRSGAGNNRDAVDLKSYDASSFGVSSETGLPTLTVTLGFQEAIDALGMTAADFAGGDTFRFNATLVMNNGMVFTSQNTGGNVISSSPFSALFTVSANVVCPSDMGGTFDFVNTNMLRGNGAGNSGSCGGTVTGTVTWANLGSGEYSSTDLGFGQYGSSCWNDSPATSSSAGVLDACNKLSVLGSDQYGIIYSYTIVSITGAIMVIDWTNDYGDAGTVTLTRQDGNNWPPLTN